MTRRDRGRGHDAAWLSRDFDEDPFAKDSRRWVRNRKTAQLCSQAQRALAGAIESELDDPRLRDLVLAEVRPHPDASNLLVIVSAPVGSDLGAAEERLRHAGGHLRELLGRAISRKRVPMLSFVVLPEGVDHAE
jgi:ribosome-binding factor A